MNSKKGIKKCIKLRNCNTLRERLQLILNKVIKAILKYFFSTNVFAGVSISGVY